MASETGNSCVSQAQSSQTLSHLSLWWPSRSAEAVVVPEDVVVHREPDGGTDAEKRTALTGRRSSRRARPVRQAAPGSSPHRP